jgi:hypothetical protein
MQTKFAREWRWFSPTWVVLVLLVLFLSPGSASADAFVFDATVNPMAGVYLPTGSGHYNYFGSSESFMPDPVFLPGVEVGIFYFAQGYVPVNPNSTVPCVTLQAGYCYNTAQFFVADSGPQLTGNGVFSNSEVAIYTSGGDPLAMMYFDYGPDAVFDMLFFSGINGAPIDIAAQPRYLQDGLANAHRIVVVGGLQDAIDARFYDGSVDSFEFVLSTPEPSALPLLVTLLVGFAVWRRLRSSAKPIGSRS